MIFLKETNLQPCLYIKQIGVSAKTDDLFYFPE